MTRLTIIKPDDAHLHLRDGPYLARTVADAAFRFKRAIIMPNLKPPITSLQQAFDYQNRIRLAVPGTDFQPLMTLYLTDSMTTQLIADAAASTQIIGLKLYPAGATTNSEAGINNLDSIYPLLEAMEEFNLPLLIHGESTNPTIDIFDREKYFLDDLAKLQQRFPSLRMVLEHITTADAVDYISETNSNLAATITVHHLLLNRNDLLVGGIWPHYYCLPVLKRRRHQEALVQAAISGNPKFFLGTDSAPHATTAKESSCGCAGIYSAHAAIELYADVFEKAGKLSMLEGFASRYAADFYNLPYNNETITLEKNLWKIPTQLDFGQDTLIPLLAGEMIEWQIV